MRAPLIVAAAAVAALLLVGTPATAPTRSAGTVSTAVGLASARGAKAAAKVQTDVRTPAYPTATSTKVALRIPADYTVRALSLEKRRGRLKVVYRSKKVWVPAKKVDRVKRATPVGRLSWAASAKKNIASWCTGVPVTARKKSKNYAYASYDGKRATERIRFSRSTPWGTRLNPNSSLALAIQYHECGHILQYRAYHYDFDALNRAMDQVYGDNGTEHMADCIADALGAHRRGTYVEKDGTRMTYVAGYGGSCSAKQLKAAKRMIAGKKA